RGRLPVSPASTTLTSTRVSLPSRDDEGAAPPSLVAPQRRQEPRANLGYPNTEIPRTFDDFRGRVFCPAAARKIPAISQQYLFIPACRADCRLCPVHCQADGVGQIRRK